MYFTVMYILIAYSPNPAHGVQFPWFIIQEPGVFGLQVW